MKRGNCPGCGKERFLNSIIKLSDDGDLLEVCKECGEFLNDPRKGISLIQVVTFKNPPNTFGLGGADDSAFWPDYPASI